MNNETAEILKRWAIDEKHKTIVADDRWYLEELVLNIRRDSLHYLNELKKHENYLALPDNFDLKYIEHSLKTVNGILYKNYLYIIQGKYDDKKRRLD